jgi:O-glycosyl hydrolase
VRTVFIAACLAAVCPAQTVMELPPAGSISSDGGAKFAFSAAGDRRSSWSVAGLGRWYSSEDLPALFSRTMVLDTSVPEGSVLNWIFTGDEGGVTVRVEPGRVRLIQRYYDSFGIYASNPPKTRYPEKIWQESEVVFRGALRTITLEMDHRLAAVILLNGKEALRQTCLLEVRRHQVAWTPAVEDRQGQVAGRILAPDTIAATVRVEPSERRQSIYGFGGILSVPAYARLSPEGKRRWWELVAEYNLLIQREYPNGDHLRPDLSNFDRLEDAFPHYYGDNFPNGEISDFEYNKRIKELGGKILFQFWDLPRWAKREYTDAAGKKWPRAPIIDEYVRAMVGYCTISKQKTGAPPDVVGIQNEVVQPAEVWHQMILALREGLDRAGFQRVKIHMPDNGNLAGGIETALAIRKSPEAWKRVDWAATHVYDYQTYFENPDGYDALIARWVEAAAGKPFLSTEFTINSNQYQSASYRVAFAQAQLYHKNMAMMNASALVYCWTLLDIEQPAFGATRSLFVQDRARGWVPKPSGHQLRAFGAFSRRLREDMVRVGAETGRGDLLATAYEGAGGRKTVILINRSTRPMRIKVDWAGARFTEGEWVSQYLENAVRPAPAEPVIEPGEIVTLTTVKLAAKE